MGASGRAPATSELATATAPKWILDRAFAPSGSELARSALIGGDWFETLAIKGLTPSNEFWATYAGK